MANVPTISSVTPSTGPAAGGALVKILGTNFRLFVPVAYGETDGIAYSRVRVTFGGVVAPRVDVYLSTELEVVTPEYGGDLEQTEFPAVSIVVQNLDDSGVPISGETVTSPAAYTYTREPLRRPTQDPASPYERVTRRLLQLVKRQLLLNANLHVHTDYSDDGISITPAGVPSLNISGPDVYPDAYGWENEPIEEVQQDGSVFVYPNPMMHQFDYTVTGHSDSWSEVLSMQGALRKFPWKNAWFVMTGDVPANAQLRMPLVARGDPTIDSSIGNANLRTCSISLSILRVPILYLPPGYRTWPVESGELQAQKYNGTLVEVKNLW